MRSHRNDTLVGERDARKRESYDCEQTKQVFTL